MNNAALNTLVSNFVSDLIGIIEQGAVDAVSEALGSGVSARRGGRRASPMLRGVARVPAPVVGRARGRGQKRAPEELEQLTEQLRSYIAKNQGQRIEQIGQGMGVSTKELALPAKKLIAAKEIRAKGQKRATKYYST